MKKLFIFLYSFLLIVLAAATFLEWRQGTAFTKQYVYGHVWFVLLWALLAVVTFTLLIKKRIYRRPAAFAVHIAFITILAGGLLSYLTGKQGRVHLRQGNPVGYFLDKESGNREFLPLTLELDSFRIAYYPGTPAPADYISYIRVSGGEQKTAVISMNRIFSYQSYRFYQSSYDRDGKGTYLTVKYDPWGIGVTYAGYVLWFLSMIWLLASPRHTFRRLIKHPLLKGSFAFFLFFVLLLPDAKAAKTVSPEQAALFSDVLILHNGRVVPFQTFAKDFTLKMTGKGRYKHYTPEQVVLGWLFYPLEWQQEPMIKVKSAALRKNMSLPKKAALTDFFDEYGNYTLKAGWERGAEGGKPSPLQKGLLETDEKVELMLMIQSGTPLFLFPVNGDQGLQWYRPVDSLDHSVSESKQLFIRHFFPLLHEALQKEDNAQFNFLVKSLKTFQSKEGGEILPSSRKIKAELWYNRIPFVSLLYRMNLILGLLAFVMFFAYLVKGNRFPKSSLRIFSVFLCAGCLFHWMGMLLRAYISGRFPMSNGFETMLFVSGIILVVSLLFSRRFPVLIPSGFLLSGFTLLVADIGQMNPQITPLVPVLNSPILSLHVSVIMISYALFAFTFINSILTLIMYYFSAKNRYTVTKIIMQLTVISRILLYPAVLLLGTGIMAGAVWANISWGNYWSWDPKEVWALITFMVYALALHPVLFGREKKMIAFHTYVLLAFACVIMTYFGVNFLLGGLHSYGG